MSTTRISATFFDVGETVINESELWGRHADRLGIPRHTFSAVFGAGIVQGLDNLYAFRVLRPDSDLNALINRNGETADIDASDLYPDVRACLRGLQALNVRVGIAGNQRGFAGTALEAMNLDVDVIGTSYAWGVEKPSVEFFERVAIEARCPISQVLYVGDRLDNDVRPALQAGMMAAHIRRGPWGYILDDPAVLDGCLFRLNSLEELPGLVAEHNLKVG